MTTHATSPSQVPVGVDPTRPSIARVYGGFLGGLCDAWWPNGPRVSGLSGAAQCIVAAVGRKP